MNQAKEAKKPVHHSTLAAEKRTEWRKNIKDYLVQASVEEQLNILRKYGHSALHALIYAEIISYKSDANLAEMSARCTKHKNRE